MDASGREDSDSQNIIKIRALGSHFVAIFRFRRTQCNTPYTVICLTLQSPLELAQEHGKGIRIDQTMSQNLGTDETESVGQ